MSLTVHLTQKMLDLLHFQSLKKKYYTLKARARNVVLRYHANDCFKDIKDFSSFIPSINLSDNDRRDFKANTSLLRELPFFDFEGPFTDKELTEIKNF